MLLSVFFFCSLKSLSNQTKKQSFLVLSDFLSVLKSIANYRCDHPLLANLLYSYLRLICDGRDTFCLGSRVCYHRGNIVVDLAAKQALEKPVNKRLVVPYSNFKVLTNMYTKKAVADGMGKTSRE